VRAKQALEQGKIDISTHTNSDCSSTRGYVNADYASAHYYANTDYASAHYYANTNTNTNANTNYANAGVDRDAHTSPVPRRVRAHARGFYDPA